MSFKNVMLCIGQSNMAGRDSSSEVGAPYTGTRADIQVNLDMSAESGYDTGVGLWEDWKDIPSGVMAGTFGPELSLSARLVDTYGAAGLHIQKCASGSTSLADHWKKTAGIRFVQTMQRLRAQVATLSQWRLSGIGWSQGCQDTLDVDDANNYESNLTQFVADLRLQFWEDYPQLPIAIVQLSSAQTALDAGRRAIVQSAQAAVAAADPYASLITTNDLSCMADNIHFDAASTVIIGNRIADALVSYPNFLSRIRA